MPRLFKTPPHVRKDIIQKLRITSKLGLVKNVFFPSLNSHLFGRFLRVTSFLSLSDHLWFLLDQHYPVWGKLLFKSWKFPLKRKTYNILRLLNKIQTVAVNSLSKISTDQLVKSLRVATILQLLEVQGPYWKIEIYNLIALEVINSDEITGNKVN